MCENSDQCGNNVFAGDGRYGKRGIRHGGFPDAPLMWMRSNHADQIYIFFNEAQKGDDTRPIYASVSLHDYIDADLDSILCQY